MMIVMSAMTMDSHTVVCDLAWVMEFLEDSLHRAHN